MNEITLPPSPNWYLNGILACASNGTVAWGARHSIVIAKTRNGSRLLDYSIIERAHADRVTSISFSPQTEEDNHRLVSGGDDHIVKIWNLKDLKTELQNSKLNSNQKVVAVDWSKHNPNLVCFISEDGTLITWHINFDSSQIITLGKLTTTCLACCPHDKNLVSIGSKSGLIYIVDIRGSGKIVYKLRGHDVDIVSLSWCPVPNNIFEDNNKKDLLLASGAKDRLIILWKAGSDGRLQTQITFPNIPLDSSSHKTKVNSSVGNFTAVCWLEPTILLSSSPWGELLLWDLVGNKKKKFSPTLIHAKHGRGLFSIAGLIDKPLTSSPEVAEYEDWRAKTNIKAIWTLAQDRQVVCCSIIRGETSIEYSIPTQGGFVYCLAACPIDTSLIAFGVGDAMIRLWNLSESYEKEVEIQTLWEKIKGKVRAISWHPEKENLLAFGTNEGRIGIFDTNTKKLPHLCKQYHRHIVYTIGWGPAPNVKEYALYTCGDGELVYYPPDKFNENPIPVIQKKDSTEFCWKPNYSTLAIGFGDGSIIFLNRDLTYKFTCHVLTKSINCLAWHPESTMSDSDISPLCNYLAVATNSTIITIFEVYDKNKSEVDESDELIFFRTITTLNGHSEKVVSLAWSPHESGFLVSGSYDHTAQVWNVQTGEVIATYLSHTGPVECCLWSPFNSNLIITGSTDFTLRIWNLTNQKALKTLPPAKTSTRGKRTKKKKIKETVIDNNVLTENELNKPSSTNEELCISENDYENNIQKEEDTKKTEDVNLKSKKKKSKKCTHFFAYAEVFNNNKLWCSSVKNLIDIVKNDKQSETLDTSENEQMESVNSEKPDDNIPLLLGKKKNLENALNNEKQILESRKQYNIVCEIDQWCNNLEENLCEAMKNSRLNDFLVSLAPSISKEFWEKICEAYAFQLNLEENPHKAVSYLLCINKIYEAIDIFMTAKLYKEAYVLASSRLNPTDPVIKNILTKWANSAYMDGNFQNAAECYIKLGEYVSAAKTLERRNDMDSLILAIDLAKMAQDSELSATLADKAVLEALMKSDVVTAKSIVEKNPEIQYREIEIEVFDELNKTVEKINDISILNWLKGLSDINILQTLSNRFNKCSKKYSILLQKNFLEIPSSPKKLLIDITHQLSLAILSDEEKQLQHIIRAFGILSQYESSKSEIINNKEKFLPLINYIVALDNKHFLDSNSIFNKGNEYLKESLRAFLCDSIIKWFNQCELEQDQISDSIDLILDIFQNCIKCLFAQETVSFWIDLDEIQEQIKSLNLDLQISEVESDDSQHLMQNIEKKKNEKNHFLNTRISSPNPFHSLKSMMKFVDKIPNAETRKEMNVLLNSTWMNTMIEINKN